MGGGDLAVELPDPAQATDRSPAAAPRVSPARLAGAGVLVAAVAVVLWGGYGHRWPWTGINGHTATLWDWLHLLLLPIAFGLLPVLLSKDARMRSVHRWGGAVAVAGFAVLVVAGYTVPWTWTGFSGNRLWDWLELLALPLAITIVPVMEEIRVGWSQRQSAVAVAALCGFTAVVIGGYVGGWTWTGFRGNTLWNWLQLLLLPLLLPTVVVPRLRPKMEATLIVVEEAEPAGAPPVSAAPAPSQADAPAVGSEPAQAGPASPESAPPPQRAPARSLDHVE